MTLWFQGGSGLMSSSLGSLNLVKFKLAPACVDICDLVLNNEGSDEGLTGMVSRPCEEPAYRAGMEQFAVC
jgi:hypothetical protein